MDPLREKGYLSTFKNGSFTLGPVLVIGTGNSPLEQIEALSPRDFFFDAPLDQLTNSAFDATLSPIASGDYSAIVGWSGIGNISASQRETIVNLANEAHSKGIRARLWDTPAWPIFARDNVWRELLEDGMDWLNADDLEAASKF